MCLILLPLVSFSRSLFSLLETARRLISRNRFFVASMRQKMESSCSFCSDRGGPSWWSATH